MLFEKLPNDYCNNEAEDEIFNLKKIEKLKTTGYVLNFKNCCIKEENYDTTCMAIFMYSKRGEVIRGLINFDPYFFIKYQSEERVNELVNALQKFYPGLIKDYQIVEKVDLDQLNHLSGIKNNYLKLKFRNLNDFNKLKKILINKYERNKKNEIFEEIIELREYDVPYCTRVCIDLDIRIGQWFDIEINYEFITSIKKNEFLWERPNFSVLAYDIETTKSPLKFPDANIDFIMMISYLIDGEGFLIVNREIVSKDIEDFEFSPTLEFKTDITIFNENSEKDLIIKFFNHIKTSQSVVIISFNGDYFDWPFVEKRAEFHEIDMKKEIGIFQIDNEYIGGIVSHIDCYYWVKRDAYLPYGSHGLKAVSKAKLGYNPHELDPELMVEKAKTDPDTLVEYSVSDAVATYYLFKKHIFDFLYALGTIIPCNIDDVLRRGSGTLCELLLMAEAYRKNIIFPNKYKKNYDKFYNGHLIDYETYVGGYVECLNNGVFRSNIQTEFNLDLHEFEKTINDVDNIINFFIDKEINKEKKDFSNINEISKEIKLKLSKFLEINDPKKFNSFPLIYHVDVGAMYPNIILTNRLQPTAIVNDTICSNCIFNDEKNDCKKNMDWKYKVDYFPLNRQEYKKIKNNNFTLKRDDLTKKIKQFCQKNYKSIKTSKIETRENIVCMRENSFYVDTVRNFTDRRYKYKTLVKVHKSKYDEAKIEKNEENMNENIALMALYDSLQLAHKIILNSFYGYVMRKGARWYSMEMAAMVTNTGSEIIQNAKEKLAKLGKPLELDTDGVWTTFPTGFPENFQLKLESEKKINFNFINSMMNYWIYNKFKNDKYQTLKENKENIKEEWNGSEMILNKLRNDDEIIYDKRTEMTIFFEIDGPYKAMIIPAAKEKNKKLKKRYAVFNFKNEITEIKGFELKRRGELNIVKTFQKEIFDQFLKGNTLQEVYDHCGITANKWMDVLESKGKGFDYTYIEELLGECKVLSKNIIEYGEQKSVSLTAANRLGEILGKESIEGKGLNLHLVITKFPFNAQLSNRSIPLIVFKIEPEKRKKLFSRWFKKNMTDEECELNNILDWDYYKERLGNTIIKLISIPSILQNVNNPIPNIKVPDWVIKIVNDKNDAFKQTNLDLFYTKKIRNINDLEGVVKENRIIKNENIKNKINEIENKDDLIENEEIIDDNIYKLGENNKLWLLQKKKLFVQKYLKKLDNPIKSSNINEFINNMNDMLKRYVWKIIYVFPSNLLGIYNCWVLIDNKTFVQAKISIKKTIFINSYEMKDYSNFKLTQKKLPFNKERIYLFKYTLNEEVYKKKMDDFDILLTDNTIENVYETKFSLVFDFIRRFKDVIKLKSKYKYIKENKFDIDYLENVDNRILLKNKIHYIFIVKINLGNNFLCLLSNPLSNDLIFISDKFILFNSYIEDLILELSKEYELNNLLINVENINIKTVKSNKFNEELQNYVNKWKTNKTIAVVNNFSFEFNFPIINSENFEDYNYNANSINIEFESYKFLLHKLFKFQKTLNILIDLSDYCQIPICNINEDFYMQCLDIIYSRHLKKFNLIDPYDNNKKDIDQYIYSYENLIENEIHNYKVENQGVHKNVNEYQIGFFNMNSIIIYNKQEELFNTLECDNYLKEILKILGEMLLNLLKDIMINKNSTADELIQNFYKWMCNKKGGYFSIELRLFLKKIMKIVFLNLEEKIDNLGGKIVFFNGIKLLIKPKNKNLNPYNFLNNIVSKIKGYPEFDYLFIENLNSWNILWFKNEFNYFGLNNNNNISSYLKEIEIFDKNIQSMVNNYIVQILNYYNLKNDNSTFKDYFEDKIKNNFIEITNNIKLFILKKEKEKLEVKDDLTLKEDLKSRSLIESEDDEEEYEFSDDSFISINENDIAVKKEKQRKKFVKEKVEENNLEINKNLLGLSKEMNDPCLEFINYFYDLLNINNSLKNNISDIKKYNMQLLNYNFYDKNNEINSENKIISIIIKDIECKKCYNILDLDLFNEYNYTYKSWKCFCNNNLENEVIENGIINHLNSLLNFIKDQSLFCKNCKKTKQNYFSKKCICFDDYIENDQNIIKEFNREKNMKFNNLKRLAHETNMYLLENLLEIF